MTVSVSERNARHGVVRTLLTDAIDYAGLFPPAQLDMAGAVAEYASYLDSSDAWALGRFVAPAARLDELAGTAAASAAVPEGAASLGRQGCWRVSAVFGADATADAARVRAFNADHAVDREGWCGRVEAVELRASTVAAISSAVQLVAPDEVELFIEIPVDGDVQTLVNAMRGTNAFAKVRTGGTTADAFPTSAELARFLAACVRADVPFKATAGLHHPLRADYALTYAPDSPRGTMFGFLNVFLAAALLRAGESQDTARDMLEERDPTALRFDERGVTWRGRHLSAVDLGGLRERGVRSFGSCSFREPIDDLTALGIL